MVKVKIICPSCKKIGFIEVLEEKMSNVARGVLAINIAGGTICSDSFIVYIDKQFYVRDYFVADFRVEIPELSISDTEKINDIKIPGKEIVNIDLIKLNLPAMLLTYILKSIFCKQKIVIIFEQEFLHSHIENFFKYITQKSFEIDIKIITEENYKKNKKEYKDSMVFENVSILRNVKKLINPKKLAVQKQIINRFLTEQDLGYSYIILKNEILKAYELSKAIVEIINESKEKTKKPINTFEINVQVHERYGIKINIVYLKFLFEIVENYFGVPVPSITDSFISL